MKQLIRNAAIVLPDQILEQGDLLLENGHICAIGKHLPPLEADTEYCFDGDILIPGLIDTHVHGAGGCDVMDGTATSLTALRRALLREGTTAFLATTLTSSPEQLSTVLANLATAAHTSSMAVDTVPDKTQTELLGVYLEGPFLSRQYKGAHVGSYIPPAAAGSDLTTFSRLIQTYPDLIRMVTVAIERPDTVSLATFCRDHGIIIAAGHTAADYDAMVSAAAAGVLRITHAFNAMPAIHHRQPGPLVAGLLNPEVELELIADGIHVHPAVLEMALRLKTPDKITLISDGTRAVGMPNGEYELGGLQTFVKNGVARLADGTLAGSAFPLLQGVRTLVNTLNHPLCQAVRMASLNPAQTLGIADRIGSLEIGKEATFVRLHSNLTIKQVWVQGKKIV